MTLLGLLHLGQSGTRASQYGVRTAGDNVANAATPGYSRRDVSLSARRGFQHGNLIIGGGARIEGALRSADNVLTSRLRQAGSNAAGAGVRAGLLARADALLGTLGDDTLATSLDGLMVAFDQLATAPQDDTSRTQVLAAATRFAEDMNRYGAAITNAQQDVEAEMAGEVDRLNSLLTELSSLSNELRGPGSDPAALDRRDMLLAEVATIVDIDVVIDDSERPEIFLAQHGAALLSDGTARPLSAVTGPTGALEIQMTTSAGVQDVSASLGGGRLGAYVQTRDGDLGALRAQLDTIAFDVATAINTVHAAGFGRDGVGGRPLFDIPATATNAAMNMRLDASVAGNPDAIAAATDPTLLPGDNRNALALAQLRDTVVTQGRSAKDALTNTFVDFGTATFEADRLAMSSAATHDSLALMKEDLTGVSIDEEMTRLMQYQQTYAAAARVIQTADELLGELLAIKR